jgi:IMP cyclohydrolase
MQNPNGPYPGRQLFLGLTSEHEPAFAYLITGRSPESRQRKAVQVENTIRIGPLGDQPYDPLRHYSAFKFDSLSGVAAVSNGIQTEAIFETYKLLLNTGSQPGKDFLEKILDGAGSEPDSYHTPRIAGVITYPADKNSGPILIVGIKGFKVPARAWSVESQPGTFLGISTYKGPFEPPEARDPQDALSKIDFKGKIAVDLAGQLFDISEANYKGNDIRVCTVAGISPDKTGWVLSIHNVHP